jgi:hypothetical protein
MSKNKLLKKKYVKKGCAVLLKKRINYFFPIFKVGPIIDGDTDI